MRQLIRASLACIALAQIATITSAADLPIPRNPARQEQAFRDLLDWNRSTLGGAYDKVGKKDARWDKPAREALEAAARVAGKAIDPPASWEDVHAPARRAVEAGCDDPLILFLYADSSRIPNAPGPEELGRRWAGAATAMEGSDYPPLRRGLAFLGAGMFEAKRENPSPEGREEAAKRFGSALALLPQAAAKEGRTAEAEQEWFIMARDLVDGYRSLGGDLRSASSRVEGVLARVPGLKAARLQVKAYWLIMEGWEIRGTGMGDTVTEDANRRFQAKNVEAYETLKQAWKADPKSYRTPTMMISIMITLGGERSEMETWFRRAMELKDNNAVACVAKMSFVDPKWYGSREEMMEFGEACLATKNWRGGITVVAADVHMRWAMQLDGEGQKKYLTSPAVWEHGRAIYEEYLSHYGTDDAVRSTYAGFAYQCDHHDESRKQFKILGDRLVGSKTFPLAVLKRQKEWFDLSDRIEAEAKARAKGQKK